MKEKLVENIKNAYLTPLAIFVNILATITYVMPIFSENLAKKLPLYLYLFLGFWIIINIIHYLQERSKTVRIDKFSVFRYFIINILCGYSIPLALSSTYIVGATINGFEVFNYWLLLVGANILSWLGLHIFLCSEFEISKAMSGMIYNLLGIIILIISIGLIIYLSIAVPSTGDDSKYIWMSIIPLLCAELLIGRSYLNLSLYLDPENDSEKEEVAE